MAIRNSRIRWGTLSITLHWLIVALVAAQIALGLTSAMLPHGPEFGRVLGYHKSVGITILMLVILRLVWRWANPVPALPSNLKPYERVLAKLTHGSLYVILIAMPLTGWLDSSASGFAVKWFNLVTLPNLVGKSQSFSDLMATVHVVLAVALGLVLLLHVAAALRHHWVLKDDTLRRMLPFTKVGDSGRFK